MITDQENVIQMDSTIKESIKLAIAIEQITATRHELSQHTIDDREFQEKLFNYLEKTLGNITTKLDTLWDDMNKRNGKGIALGNLGVFANACVTLILSAGTALIIMKYGK